MLNAVGWCDDDATRITNIDELLNACLAFLLPTGLGFISYAQIYLFGPSCIRTNFPKAWHVHYIDNAMVNTHPVISTVPTTSTLRAWPNFDKDSATAEFNESAQAFGVPKLGAALGFSTIAGFSVFSVGFDGAQKEWQDILENNAMALNLVAVTFCIRASQITEKICLTNREHDVLLWTARGKTSWEIGKILGLTEGTVNQYLKQIMKKANAKNRVQCVARAIELGLLNEKTGLFGRSDFT